MKTTRMLFFAVVLALLLNSPIFAAAPAIPSPLMKVVNSRITSVTVYSDRAQVTRSAREKLPAGEHRLVFEGLPSGLEADSIQVDGMGNAELGEVKLGVERLSEIPDRERKRLMDEKTDLQDQIADLEARARQAKNEKNFVENISKKLTGVSEKAQPGELEPEKWVKMVDFYRTRNAELDRELRETEKARREVNARVEKVDREIADLGRGGQKNRYQVEIAVTMKSAGDLSLALSYIVHGPGWQPAYDLRVSSHGKKMTLAYNAVVRQNTSESWDDASLVLSTAQPRVGGRHPELSPWHVNFFEPRRYDRPAAGSLAPAPAMMNQMMQTAEKKKIEPQPVEESETVLAKPGASLQTNATSVVFEIRGKTTIPSDNQPHRVTVLVQEFPADFRYSSVPKLSPRAYLKARVKNTTDFPLLPGVTNIFLDSTFVANGSLDPIAPGEEFWTFLGVDEGIKVDRKFVKKYQKQEGLFGKKTKMVYEYLTEITNNKKTEEELVLWDQIPISSHQDIVVSLVEPQYEKDTPTLKKNEMNYFEWLFTMKPMQKIKIPFVFSVEYPPDKQVTGLE